MRKISVRLEAVTPVFLGGTEVRAIPHTRFRREL
jgi:hypothetical protein